VFPHLQITTIGIRAEEELRRVQTGRSRCVEIAVEIALALGYHCKGAPALETKLKGALINEILVF
jgi:hypothetical protein